MTILDKYLKIKQEVDADQREIDKAEGALQIILEQLESSFKVKTIQEAKQLLKKRKTKLEKLKEKAEKALEDFDKKWSKKYA